MPEAIKLRKGFDINLAGKAESKTVQGVLSKTFAVKPTDFIGMYRPKLLVHEGDVVKAGTPLFYDKKMEEVMYVAPVSGEVIEIKRGEKRKLLEVIILADSIVEYEPYRKYTVSELSALKKDEIRSTLLKSGIWPQIIQRPYGIVADPDVMPKAIFISAFDTHPLAPDYNYLFKGQEQAFQVGINLLRKLASCPVNIGISTDAEVSKVFSPKNAELTKVSGKHPAGNVGVQIHNIQPINKGETVWTLNPYGVIQIGKLFLKGQYDASKLVALTGSEVSDPQYYQTYLGACIEEIVNHAGIATKNVRYVSGNVLTGHKIDYKGYVSFYDHQVTILPEGDKPRFFLTEGWLSPVTSRLSFHRALGLLSFLNPKKSYKLDTSLNGEERAFVMSGNFEAVTPMDILPMHLIKAILAHDYDGMEALGIYEVVEEDLALCEFIAVSKQPIQQILREGLDLMRVG